MVESWVTKVIGEMRDERLKEMERVGRGEEKTLDFRNFLNTYEVIILFRLMTLLIDICEVIVIAKENDLHCLFLAFDQVQVALLQSLGFGSDNKLCS